MSFDDDFWDERPKPTNSHGVKLHVPVVTTLTTSTPIPGWANCENLVVKRGRRTFLVSRETIPRWQFWLQRIQRWLKV